MTDAPARPRRADFGWLRPISTRWTDNDIYGHVNNAVYYQYFDSVINRYLIEQGGLDIQRGEVVGFIVRSECDYFAPVTYPGDVDIGVAVLRLGRSSVTYETGLFRPGEDAPCAVARMVHVFVEVATNRPQPIPALLREALARLQRPA
ncbi:MAG: acyl-CoA thioesterase [Burkholderiaceae bacterium]|nr:acyl-CoA thioesterase [Burkholderiaceae bacterium]